MVDVNYYHRNLSESEVAAGVHRQFVGGLWDEIGKLQFDFLVLQGLKPAHTLVDVGCGALRGGLHFIRYLEPGRYFGLDINSSLIGAGQKELQQAGLADKRPVLLVNDRFELTRFGRKFDYGVGVSLITHLYLNHIGRCLAQMRQVMHESSRFYLTFFEAPSPIHLAPIRHVPGDVTTYYDADPFHQSAEEIGDLAKRCDLDMNLIGDWGHPRNQRMICLTRK
jgi:cyclopropane fatty-acyl-phospholipid synthase-like methyltransferase